MAKKPKLMNQHELNEKVRLLKAGQVVEINRDFYKAIKFEPDEYLGFCSECDIAHICCGDVVDVCRVIDNVGSTRWRLTLAHPA